jgi:hypothetical protein
VRGGGWKGLTLRCGGWKTLYMSEAEVVDELTRLAKECDSEEAVDWSWDCMLFVLCSRDLELLFVSCLGLVSVFRRRSTPDTA